MKVVGTVMVKMTGTADSRAFCVVSDIDRDSDTFDETARSLFVYDGTGLSKPLKHEYETHLDVSDRREVVAGTRKEHI